MLEKRCYECHNVDKSNGGLQMHTTELLSKGGDGGPVLVSGKAIDSELFERITKDPISKKFMPTGGKTHLGYEEVKLIGWWINEGADYDKSIADLNVPKDIKTILEDSYKVSLVKKSYVETATVDPLPAENMETLTALGFTGAPLASGNNFLDIDNLPDHPPAIEIGDSQSLIFQGTSGSMGILYKDNNMFRDWWWDMRDGILNGAVGSLTDPTEIETNFNNAYCHKTHIRNTLLMFLIYEPL